MQSIFTKIASVLLAPVMFIGGLLGITHETQAPAPEVTLGQALPQAVGVFETSLASPITSTATSMTLTANAIRGGGSLSGYNCFTVDEGSSQAEVICGTVSGTSVTALQRGISYSTGTTTVATNQFAHRRGANVKITDFPIIQILKAQNNGESEFENPLKYSSSLSTSTIGLNSSNLASVGYANSLSFGAIPAASESASGFVELATGIEAASSTSIGSTGARLVIPASAATSTKPVSGSYAVITQGGAISNTFFAGITLSASSTLATTTYIGSTASTTNLVINIGKNSQVFTASGNFSVPNYVNKVYVRMTGGGGGGGNADCANCTAGSAGAGEYAEGWIDVSATTTVAVTIGAGGLGGTTSGATGATGGTTSFGNFMTATGGIGGEGKTSGVGIPGLGGSTGTGGSFRVPGNSGEFGAIYTGTAYRSGRGGANALSAGGLGVITDNPGNPGKGYGGGGSAAVDSDGSGSGQNGGNGTDGIAIISW